MSYVHDQVTRQLLEHLEAGAIPWQQRWQVTGAAGLPRNFVSERPYSGVNILLLWLSSLEQGFSDRRWLTFNQVKALGGSIKGQSATRIIFAGPGTKRRADGEEEAYTCVKFYNLFNGEQVEGVTLGAEAPAEPFKKRLNVFQAFVEA